MLAEGLDVGTAVITTLEQGAVNWKVIVEDYIAVETESSKVAFGYAINSALIVYGLVCPSRLLSFVSAENTRFVES